LTQEIKKINKSSNQLIVTGFILMLIGLFLNVLTGGSQEIALYLWVGLIAGCIYFLFKGLMKIVG